MAINSTVTRLHNSSLAKGFGSRPTFGGGGIIWNKYGSTFFFLVTSLLGGGDKLLYVASVWVDFFSCDLLVGGDKLLGIRVGPLFFFDPLVLREIIWNSCGAMFAEVHAGREG